MALGERTLFAILYSRNSHLFHPVFTPHLLCFIHALAPSDTCSLSLPRFITPYRHARTRPPARPPAASSSTQPSSPPPLIDAAVLKPTHLPGPSLAPVPVLGWGLSWSPPVPPCLPMDLIKTLTAS